MENDFIAKSTVVIKAPPAKVWEALTNPEIIKQYLFGTSVETDWKVGSPITYKGTWEDKEYQDKGKILIFEPGKHMRSTYWSSMSNLPDLPENYKNVDTILADVGGNTQVTITQDNNESEEKKNHSEQNWNMVLGKMKEILEK